MTDKPDRYAEWLAIPPGPRPPDHYTLLGIQRFESDTTVIEKAAIDRLKRIRQYCMKFPAEGTQFLNEITKARMCLLDAVERAAYDESLGRADLQAEAVAEVHLPTIAPLPTVPDFGRKIASEDTLAPLSTTSKQPSASLEAPVSSGLELPLLDPIPEASEPLAEVSEPPEIETDWDTLLEECTRGASLASVESDASASDTETRKRYCPHCGNAMLSQECICSDCVGGLAKSGAWVDATCPDCRQQLAIGMVICRNCHTDLSLPSRNAKLPPRLSRTIEPFQFKHANVVATAPQRIADLYERGLAREKRLAGRTRNRQRHPMSESEPPFQVWDAILTQWDRPGVKLVVVSGIAAFVMGVFIVSLVASRHDRQSQEVVMASDTATSTSETDSTLREDDRPNVNAVDEPKTESQLVDAEGLNSAERGALLDLMERIDRQKQNSSTSTWRWAMVVSELTDLAKKHTLNRDVAAALEQSRTLLNKSFRNDFVGEWNDAETESAQIQVINLFFEKPESQFATDSLMDLMFSTLIADVYVKSRIQALRSDLRLQRFKKVWESCGEAVPPPIAFKANDIHAALEMHIQGAYSQAWNQLEQFVNELDDESDFVDALKRVDEFDVGIPRLADEPNLKAVRQTIASRANLHWANYKRRVGPTVAAQFCSRIERFPYLDAEYQSLIAEPVVPSTTTPSVVSGDGEPGVSRPLTYDEAKREVDKEKGHLSVAVKKAFPSQTQEAFRAHQKALIRNRKPDECYYAIMVGRDRGLEAWGNYHAGYVIAKALSAHDAKKPPKVVIGCGRTPEEARTHLESQLEPKPKPRIP